MDESISNPTEEPLSVELEASSLTTGEGCDVSSSTNCCEEDVRSNISLKSQTSGLGALLGQLRTCPESIDEEIIRKTDRTEEFACSLEVKLDEIEDSKLMQTVDHIPIDATKLNRKERRALMAKQGTLRTCPESIDEEIIRKKDRTEEFACSSEVKLDEIEDSKLMQTVDNIPIDVTKLNRKERRALMAKQGTFKRHEEPAIFALKKSRIENEDNGISLRSPNTSLVESAKPVVTDSQENILLATPSFDFEQDLNYTKSSFPKHFDDMIGRFSVDNKPISNNFVKNVRFSTSGRYLSSDSQDNSIRIFGMDKNMISESPSLTASLPQGGFVYDMVWHPSTSMDCLMTSSIGRPIHLYNAHGERRASFRGINHLDELEPAFCIAWKGPNTIVGGYGKGTIRFFDVDRPGKAVREEKTWSKQWGGPRSKLSTISSNESGNTLLVGSYTGTVSIWSMDMWAMHLDTYNGAISQMKMIDDFHFLVSHTKNDCINCYDLRMPENTLYSLQRPSETHQKIFFDIDRTGRWLCSGSTDGSLYIFDLNNVSTKPFTFSTASCSITSASFHPEHPIIACSSGERVFPIPLKDAGDEDDVSNTYRYNGLSFENAIHLWKRN